MDIVLLIVGIVNLFVLVYIVWTLQHIGKEINRLEDYFHIFIHHDF